MKHDTSQEKLYQQFLDELQPGAEEYDRMMQMGKNPAALHRPRRTILRYAAAACLLLAATALTWILWHAAYSTQSPALAEQAQPQPSPSPAQAPQPIARAAIKTPSPPCPKTKDPTPPSPQKSTAAPSRNPPAPTANPESLHPSPPPPQPDPQEVERQKSIIENKLQHAILEWQISREIVDRTILQTKPTQTILCAI